MILLQFGVFLIDSATLAIMLKAIGSPLPFSTAFPAHVMASVAATIAPIPLGLGTYEATAVALLHVSGSGSAATWFYFMASDDSRFLAGKARDEAS